uniref:ATP synthase F0 subunit 8 n=1 Tax=Glossiphonia concolor TaxID=321041 RepID=A0A7D7AGD8_9ANNE|nr:ATP synthase F0 subunit 8 [Glossiphonia concolor]
MPHLSPMSWMYSLLIIWFCMFMFVTNMWWFSMKPMSPIIKNNTNTKKYMIWNW